MLSNELATLRQTANDSQRTARSDLAITASGGTFSIVRTFLRARRQQPKEMRR
jgi:hypothetical protein